MTALYSVAISLGDDDAFGPAQYWTLEHVPTSPTGHAQVTDGICVLAGLRFGWSTPDQSLWPAQPNPMTAALAVTMPDFDDAPWMSEGSPVAIRVSVAGAERFAFYGRVSDAQAVPRSRPRTGVTLSLAAVDYTVDPLEGGPYADPDAGEAVVGPDNLAIEATFAAVPMLGVMPDWPTTPTSVLIPIPQQPRAIIDEILQDSVSQLVIPAYLGGDGVATEWARGMFAPIIDPVTGLQPPTSEPRWAFDLLWRHPLTPRLVVEAKSGLERDSLTWSRNKRGAPSKIIATAPGDLVHEVTNPDHQRAWGADVVATLTCYSSEPRLGNIASFYLPDSTPPTRGWRIDLARWQLTRANGIFVDLPPDLMPRWDLAQGDPQRSSCYGRLLQLTGLADDLNPYAGTDHPEVVGLLSGVDLAISGGHLSLDLKISQLQEEP